MFKQIITVNLESPSRFAGVDVCNIRVCLTWTVQKNYLDIRCRVNSLRFGVEFINNDKKEQGFCVHPRPIPKCFTSYNNTLIIQNSLTNITYLRIQGEIDSHFNGEWECKHGTNRDSATINVTVLDSGNYISVHAIHVVNIFLFFRCRQQSYLLNLLFFKISI